MHIYHPKNRSYSVRHAETDFRVRRKWVQIALAVGMVLLVGRAVDLQVLNKRFLQDQGANRQIGVVSVSAYRGKILDRNGEPLAISTPVQSIWVDPEKFEGIGAQQLRELSGLLEMPENKLRPILAHMPGKRFAYVKRRVSPGTADAVKAMQLPGVYFEREFKRYYPAGEVTAHLLGFTDIEDVGQEGLELAYEQSLKGSPGSKRVIRDGKRRIIEDIENIREPVPGKDLQLSIDQRLQYLAYRELKAAMLEHKAEAASLVMLDAKTGDILAAVNQPSFNPNTRKDLGGKSHRNRAITDAFEPGSTIKPFVIAHALDAGYIKPGYQVDTSPGRLHIGAHTVKDVHNYGRLDLTGILKKSSNVAVSRIALEMQPQLFWKYYRSLGFGMSAGTGFPAETSGELTGYERLHDFERATLSFGYGVSMSVLQLARAYTVFADDGILHSASLLKRDKDPDARRVLSVKTARRVRTMLEQVVQKDGTAYRARVDGYGVAGKTGTIKKLGNGGYTEHSYLAAFVGMAPAKDPRLVIAVMVDEPRAGDYYGGLVAGPVFSRVMTGALRVLNIPPDQEETMPVLLVKNTAGETAGSREIAQR
jgi:cell division protein FtsI (penicillin-binding protein 3)